MTIIVYPDDEAAGPYVTIKAEPTETSILEIDESTVISLYKKHGAILLSGFDLTVDKFREFTDKYCQTSVFNESNDRKTVDAKKNIQTVNLGTDAFPLHPELSREPWKPDVCFFACLTPPAKDGETTICDGIEIVKKLPPKAAAIFRENRLDYILPATANECEYWLGASEPDELTMNSAPANCPYKFARNGEQIIRIYNVPALHKPMFSNDLAFGNFILFSRYYSNRVRFPTFTNRRVIPQKLVDVVKTTSDSITTPIKWQQNDVLILDNTRFLHGRNKVVDPQDRLIISIFGYLKFAIPGEEEVANAPWRNSAFIPPH